MPNEHDDDKSRVQAAWAGIDELRQKEKTLLEQLYKLSGSQNFATKDDLKRVYFQQATIFFDFFYKEAPFTYGMPSTQESLVNALSACEKALSIDPNYIDAKKLRDKIMRISE